MHESANRLETSRLSSRLQTSLSPRKQAKAKKTSGNCPDSFQESILTQRHTSPPLYGLNKIHNTFSSLCFAFSSPCMAV